MEQIMQRTRKQISLVVTYSCNLQCTYCYEANKSHYTMPISIAKKAILNAFDTLGEHEELEIDFFGGEPFLCFEFIKEIFNWVVYEVKPTLPYIFFATTNGTLIHKHIQQWVFENRSRFYCGLSIDGTKWMHDVNRSSSFDQIDIDFFAKTWADQSIKMTISNETLPYLYEGVLFLQNKGFKVECNLAEGIDWSNSSALTTLHTQLMKLATYFLQNDSTIIPRILDIDFKILENEQRFTKWCGAGENSMCTIDVDGQVYPCQMFTPLSAGKLSKVKEQIPLKEELLYDESCRNCILGRVCGTCYGTNYLLTGNPAKRNHNMCKIMRIRAIVSAFYNSKKIEKSIGTAEMTEEEARSIYSTLNGIKKLLAASSTWDDLSLEANV